MTGHSLEIGIVLRIACAGVGMIGPAGVVAQPAAPVSAAVDLDLRAEILFWESMKDSRNAAELRAYLAAYPDGRFASLARTRLTALAGEKGGETGSGPAPSPNDRGPPVPHGPSSAPRAGGAVSPSGGVRDCDACPSMVVVPAGGFRMGASEPGAGPAHEVVIARAFAIGTHETSVAQWEACVKEGACRQSPQTGRDGSLPVANVSWEDAQSYARWLSAKTGQTYRLPSEAEWEYGARAGTTTHYWWGDEKGGQRANCADCGSPWGARGPAPVGSFAPNAFGLFDVHGNVWEWTQDCWNDSYQGAPLDGRPQLTGDCLSRVIRGGSWALGHEYMRSSRRGRYDRDVRYHLNGFRVVKELPEAAGAPAVGDAPFETAVLVAANAVFSKAPKPPAGADRQSVVIDPLVDGLSGAETAATRAIKSRIAELIRASYPQFDLKDFSAASATSRYLLIGTFTGVNKQRESAGAREAFRICLRLLELQSGKIVSAAKEFSQAAGVDITPTAFFRDSPAWIPDPSTQAYIRSCHASKPGDPIDPLYADRIKPAALLAQAIEAYDKGEYRQSQDLFRRASATREGEQLRTYNGLYLTSWKLGERDQATQAFARIVEYGLGRKRLGVNFPFSPASSEMATDADDEDQAGIWLSQIARKAASRKDCLEIVGHSHRDGPEVLNERLSLRRAEHVMRRLEAEAPELRGRMIATGKGSAESLVGSGTADARDALDRRVELEAIDCSPPAAKATR